MSINSWFNRYAITAAVLLLCFAFLPDDKTNARPEAPVGNCTPNWEFSTGYTFIRPDLIDIRTAYAPYLLEWGSFYRDSFSTIDWQKKENVEEVIRIYERWLQSNLDKVFKK